MAPGAVGLTNEGATGYLNVVLQALFHIPAIREAVLALPLEGVSSDPQKCPPLAWQRLFRNMSSCLGRQSSFSTREITQAMGWQAHHLNLGQDAHGMLYVLLLILQHTCLLLKQPDTVQQLFVGTITDSSSFTLLSDHPTTAAAAAPSHQQARPIAPQAQQQCNNSNSGPPATAAAAAVLSRPAYKPQPLPIHQVDQDRPFVTLDLLLYNTTKKEFVHNILGGLGLCIPSSTVTANLGDSVTLNDRLPPAALITLEEPLRVLVEALREQQQQQQQQPPCDAVQNADQAEGAAGLPQQQLGSRSIVDGDQQDQQQQQQQQQSGALAPQLCHHHPQGPTRVIIITDSKISKPPPILVLHLSRSVWHAAHDRYMYLKHAVDFPEFLDVRSCCACSSSSSSLSTVSGSMGQVCAAGSQAVQLLQQEMTGQQHVPADRLYCLINVVSLMSLPGSTLRRYCIFVRGPTPADVEQQQQQQQCQTGIDAACQPEQQQHGPRLQYSPGSSRWIRVYNEQVDRVPPDEALHQQYGLQSPSPTADTHFAAQHSGAQPETACFEAGSWCDTSSGEEADSVASMLMYVRMDQWDRVMNSSSSSSSSRHSPAEGLADIPTQQQAQQQQQQRHQQQGDLDLSSYYHHLYHRGFYFGSDDHVDRLYQYMHELVSEYQFIGDLVGDERSM